MLVVRSRAQFIARVALLVALCVVVRRVLTPQVSGLNLGGLPILLSGLLMGPVGGAYVGAISDIVGMAVAPAGFYHPFYTLTAALTGALPSFFMRLGRREARLGEESDLAFLGRLTMSLMATQLVTKVLLFPLFQHVIMQVPIREGMLWHLAVQLLHVPCYSLLIFSLLKALRRSPALQWTTDCAPPSETSRLVARESL